VDHPLKVVFFGTPDFAVPALQALIDSPHEVICVYTQPPRPKGRGYKIQKTPVHALAEAHNIEVRTPENLKKDEQAQQAFRDLDADIGVVAAYGLIFPEAVLQAPRYGCLNIHASLLPRWRGAAPIQHAIWAGDSATGVTIMQMDAGLDTGAIITASSTAISDTTKASELHDILADQGARLIVATLDKLADRGELNATPQDEVQATYAPMLGRDDGRIDWTQPAQSIDRQYRALSPWPGIWTIDGQGRRLKVRALE
jgi:methionyl-tRNA formyltransferase